MRLDLHVAKAVTKDGAKRFVSVASTEDVDLEQQRCTKDLFKSFIDQTRSRGMPWLGVAHYPDSRIGTHDRMYVDGSMLKLEGQFDPSNPMAEAAYESLRRDRDNGTKRVKTSVGFYPTRARMEKSGVLAFTAGWIEHNALTTAPANPNTDISLVEKGHAVQRAHTMYEDAMMIVGKDFADVLQKNLMDKRVRRSSSSIFLNSAYGPGERLDAIVVELLDGLREAIEGELPENLPVVFAEEMNGELAEVSASGLALVVSPGVVRSLTTRSGLIDLADPDLIALTRGLISYLAANSMPTAGLESADDSELVMALDKSTTRSNHYLQKLVDLTSESVPPTLMERYKLTARGHAGGKMVHIKPLATPAESMALSKLSDKDLEALSDDELTHLHGRVHKLYSVAED